MVFIALLFIPPQRLLLASHDPLPYDKLCICAGARPKELAVPPDVAASGRVLTLRDTGSVERLAAALGTARRVVVVGNGGIALQCMWAAGRGGRGGGAQPPHTALCTLAEELACPLPA